MKSANPKESTPLDLESDNSLNLLIDLTKTIWSKKLPILNYSTISGFIFLALSYLIQPAYTSSAVVATASNSNQHLFAQSKGLSSIASFAGISLPNDSKEEHYIAMWQSKDFLIHFLNKHSIKQVIFPDHWDDQKNTWRKESAFTQLRKRISGIETNSNNLKPDDYVATQRFLSENFHISQDRRSSLINIYVTSPNPNLSQRWGQLLISEINQYIREKEKEEAHARLIFLETKLRETQEIELRKVLTLLYQNEIEGTMLINANQEYAFATIDAPSLISKSIRPQRTIIAILGFAACFALTTVIYYIKYQQRGATK